MKMAVRLWEETKGEGECKNQICRCCYHWNKGGPHQGHGRQMLHRIDGRWGGNEAFSKGGAQKSSWQSRDGKDPAKQTACENPLAEAVKIAGPSNQARGHL